ncbi:MAG: helix-turn-helix transcriptional regulator [Kiritimatiellae bacterium]|nr:helix-turn-helix transcriptional regulator [Kiritimatiellia bacterium]
MSEHFEYELHPKHDQPDFRGLKTYKGYPELMRQSFVFPQQTFSLVVHRLGHRICETVWRRIALRTNRHLLRYCVSGGGVLLNESARIEFKPGRLFVATRDDQYASPPDTPADFEDFFMEFSLEDHLLGERRIEEIEAVNVIEVPQLYVDLSGARRRKFEARLFRLVRIMAVRRPGYPFRVREQILAVFALCLEWGVLRLVNLRRENFSRHWHHYLWVRKARQFIDGHFTRPLSLRAIGQFCGVDPGYLNRLFRKDIGMSMNQYLNDVRIRKARDLMHDGVTSVTEIAFATGFQHASYFSTRFRQATGRSPREYIRGLGGKDPGRR